MMSDSSDKNETLDDLFDIEIEKSESKIDNNNTELARMYQIQFGHAIPFYLLPETVSEEEIFDKVKYCLEKGKDNLLELFECRVDQDVFY